MHSSAVWGAHLQVCGPYGSHAMQCMMAASTLTPYWYWFTTGNKNEIVCLRIYIPSESAKNLYICIITTSVGHHDELTSLTNVCDTDQLMSCNPAICQSVNKAHVLHAFKASASTITWNA